MDPNTIKEVQEITQDLLQQLEVDSDVVVEVDETAVIRIDIQYAGGSEVAAESEPLQPEKGILIGYHGETLRSLQLVLSMLINKGREDWFPVVVDVDGYRRRREEQLTALAKRMAEKVMYLKEPIALSPMPAGDRRIVHLALEAIDGVTSESSGAGYQRKIVVMPA